MKLVVIAGMGGYSSTENRFFSLPYKSTSIYMSDATDPVPRRIPKMQMICVHLNSPLPYIISSASKTAMEY